MKDLNRLHSLLQMICLLNKPGGYPVGRLASRFDVSKRTIYRYLDIIRDCGFEIENRRGRHRFKKTGEMQQLFPLLNADEAALLREAVLSMSPSLPKRSDLLIKLELIGSPDRLAELIVDTVTGQSIRVLAQAIEERKRVILGDYHSIHGGTVRDREVDPVGFSVNLRYLFAFDPEQEQVVQFKPERIGRVELTGVTFEPDERYEIRKPDMFGMNGKPRCMVTVCLNRRALHLLLEEYPESREFVTEKRLAEWSDSGNEATEIRLEVNGFDGVGRFVLGLPGEVEATDPPEFLQYLEERRNRRMGDSVRSRERNEEKIQS